MSKSKELKTLETIIDRDVPFEERAKMRRFLKKLMDKSGGTKGAVSDKEMKAMKEAAKGSGIGGGGVKKTAKPQKKKYGGSMKAKGMAMGGKMKAKGMKAGGKMKAKGMAMGGKMKAKGMAMGGKMKAKGMAMGGKMKAKGMAMGGKMKAKGMAKARPAKMRAPSNKNSGLFGK
jgi:hypothetical protein